MTRSDLRQEKSFFGGSVSSFLQLVVALLRDHAENPVEFYIVQAHDLCNFGAISSKQWKVIAISVSEPRFYVGELRNVFKSLLNRSV